MIRWTIVACVVVGIGASLVGTYDYEQHTVGALADEILAYEITPTRDVWVDIPAGTSSVQLTTWALLPPAGQLAPLEALPYGVEVELWDRATGATSHRRYGVWSRVAPESRGQGVVPGFVASLADGPEWVTDPRTVDLDTRRCAARGGRLRVRALDGTYHQLLARLSYRFGRGRVERDLFERGLDATHMRRLLNQTTALGFADLAPHARDRVLSFWGRRLTAIGRSQVNYRMRRLLVGRVMEEDREVELKRLDVLLWPGRRAAFNFSGASALRVQGPARAVLSVRDGDDAQSPGWPANRDSQTRPTHVAMSDEGYADITLVDHGLRTVTVASDTQGTYLFSLASRDAHTQVGETVHITTPDGRVQISPDVRLRAHYRLSHDAPVVLRAEPDQGPFRVRVRAMLAKPDGRALAPGPAFRGLAVPADGVASQVRRASRPSEPRQPWTGRFWARWLDPDGRVRREEVHVSLWPSLFDFFGPDVAATEHHTAYLFAPSGVRELQLYGDPELAVTVAVREPGVDASQLHPAYRLALDSEQRFLNAPQEVGSWATIEPEQADGLRRSGRHVSLHAQVRLVVGPPGEREPPERVVVPVGHPPRRALWVHRALSDAVDAPREWFELGETNVLRIASEGEVSPELRLRFQVGVQQLGKAFAIVVDGQERYRSRLVVPSGEVAVSVTPGLHEVIVSGLGEQGVAYADAPPRVPMEALREYSVFELATGELVFPIARSDNEPLRLVLFVATEGSGIPWKLRYQVEAQHAARRPGVFFREPTEQSGLLEGVSGEREIGLLWQGHGHGPRVASQARDGVSKTRIRLGDDLRGREQRVRLQLERSLTTASRVWVRAVLVGQADVASRQVGRQWTREVADEVR